MRCIHCDACATAPSLYRSGLPAKQKNHILLNDDGDPVCSYCQSEVDKEKRRLLLADVKGH